MARQRLKTTVYLYEDDYRRLQALARRRDLSAADLVREAVSQYAASEAPRRIPGSVAAGRSGRRDLSEKAEELLAGFGRK